MEKRGMYPPQVGRTTAQVLVTIFKESLVDESLKVATILRQGGLKTALYFENDKLGKQIADKKGIPYVVIVGPDEVAAGQVKVRNLALREGKAVNRDEAV